MVFVNLRKYKMFFYESSVRTYHKYWESSFAESVEGMSSLFFVRLNSTKPYQQNM